MRPVIFKKLRLAFCLTWLCALAMHALAQDRTTPGHSIGTVTTEGNLIILNLDENALGRPHLFDLAHRTVRFTPDGTRYRAETLPESWDSNFGTEMTDPHAVLTKFDFPFSGKTWSTLSVGITGSITFGEAVPNSARTRRGVMPPNHDGGLAVERYALMQRVGSTFINNIPAIAVFFKPRMTGARYLKELDDRAVITWALSEPFSGIQDWTWKPTVNRFQAVLYKDGVIDLTWDVVSARDGIVGVFPVFEQESENPIASLSFSVQPGTDSSQAIQSVKLSAVGGVYLKAVLETAAPISAPAEVQGAAPTYRLCLSTTKTSSQCTIGAANTTMWTVQAGRQFRGESAGRSVRYFATGPGVLPEADIQGREITIRGVLPAGVRADSQIYVSVSGAAANLAQAARFANLGSPEMNLADIKKSDGAFPVIYESFYYPESPRPNDLTCTVINALGDRFDMLAYYSDFRIDNPEAGTPSTGPLGGGPNGGEVTGIGAKQRNLDSYCTKGRFQWQFVQPVDMDANQMFEYPPDDVIDMNHRDIVAYKSELVERTFNGKIPPYDYAMSQIGHEMGHRWSPFVSAKVNGELIPLGPTHWATGLQAPVAFPYQRPVEASAMGGGVWQDNFDGTFTQLDDDYYVPATGWSYLDLYLMGFISAKEVPNFFILRNLAPQGRDANGDMIFKADRTKITINDVIAAEGPRLPDVEHSQKEFNTGIVIVLEHGHKPPAALLERTNGIRLRWMDYWETTTGHRSMMTTDPH